ncbi:MAG TPA: hypothetical protein VG308_07380 [Stellaceae bacterium]|nr:hypothetical protein [Stellaceae bacterium]
MTSIIDPFALGGAADGGDDREILALFNEWRREGERYASAGEDDPLFDEIGEGRQALYQAICDAPAHGVVGLAIKAFLAAHAIFPALVEGGTAPGEWICNNILGAPEPENWAPSGRLRIPDCAIRGMVHDAVRFVPELAPLAELLTSAPAMRDAAVDERHGR